MNTNRNTHYPIKKRLKLSPKITDKQCRMSKFYDKLISANTYLSAGERQALLQQLDGRNFNNLDAISAAEHAFGELVRTGIQSEGELAKILRLAHIDPADLWESCYGA